MFPTFISILDIQSWWEVPSIAHFCSLFRTAFNLLDFDIEDLEEALLTDGTEESSWLQELIVRLLSGCLPKNEISTFNYQMFLRRLFRQKCQEHDRYNPFNTDIDFQLLPLRSKVDILQALCDFRLDADDVLEQLKNLEADSLRVEPLGYDGNDSAYWYFYGTRLYREDFKSKNKKKSVWQVICFTEDDWFQLTKKFKTSESEVERQLYQTLNENFLPELPRLFKEKERLARKRLLEKLPKRSSSRLRKLEEDSEKESVEAALLKEKSDQVIEVSAEDKKKLKRQEAYERRNQLKLLSEEEDTLSEASVHRHEMAGTRNRKSKGRQRTVSNSSVSSRDNIPTKSSKAAKKNEKSSVSSESTTSSKLTTVGRQTNNSLSAATGQILIQTTTNPHKKKLKTSQIFRQTDEDLQTGMHKILDFVKNHEDAWPFAEPVEEEYAPNYYTIIRKPMDLQRMEERLDSGFYKTFSKFRADFQLIVDNCRLYNGAENEYTEMVDNLVKVFERATEKYLDQISSSDDEVAVDFSNIGKDQKPEEASASKRKPTLAAQTGKKRERSLSENSSIDRRSDSIDTYEETTTKTKKSDVAKKQGKNKSKKEKLETKKEKLESKKEKHELNDTKKQNEVKKGKGSKKSKEKKSKSKKAAKKDKKKPIVESSSPSCSPSRSPRSNLSSPRPSWPPSSPENRFDFVPHKSSKKRTSQEMSDSDESVGKGKHKKSNKHKDDEVIKEFDFAEKKFKPDYTLPPMSPKPKDKHNKLRETIEKLKAKSEQPLVDEFNFEMDLPKENKEKAKKPEKEDTKIKSKSKEKPVIKPKKDIVELDFDTNSIDSIESEERKLKSVIVPKQIIPAAKTTSNLEALSIATEQTLKDINKWLDDTPKFAEFSSASNSPSYTGLDEFDILTGAKIEQIPGKKVDKPSGLKKEVSKDVKKKPFRDPSKFFKRREVQRTIDRLQPGKSKGNLISNVQNTNKTEEMYPLGPLSKIKDTKNSLIVKTDTNAPKLSLGSVLDTFGKHKFLDDQKKEEQIQMQVLKEENQQTLVKEPISVESKAVDAIKEDKEVKEDKIDKEPSSVAEVASGEATPNLSAWFKAFGAPKMPASQKKNDIKPDGKENEKAEDKTSESKKVTIPLASPNIDSPHGQPAPRQRKISTGSSMSERSSFSQDMDSPRVGIDERGAYPAPYPSPLHRSPSGASPVIASPRPDISPKGAAYPTINGQIRVGFYQDTVSNKSSPDKSCSPRENPQSPYPHYSEHVYTPNTTGASYYSYANSPYYSHAPNYSNTNPTPPYNLDNSSASYYDNSKLDHYQAKSVPSNQSSPAHGQPYQNSPNLNNPHSPSLHSPGVNSPGVHSPGVHSPGLQSPGVHSPGVHSPGLHSPGVHSPGVHSPGMHSPGVHSPGVHSPGLQSPGVHSPGVHSPHSPSVYSQHSPSVHPQTSPSVNQQLSPSIPSPSVQNPPSVQSQHSPVVHPQHSPSIHSPSLHSPSIHADSPEMEMLPPHDDPKQLLQGSSQSSLFPVKKRAYNDDLPEINTQRYEIDARLLQQKQRPICTTEVIDLDQTSDPSGENVLDKDRTKVMDHTAMVSQSMKQQNELSSMRSDYNTLSNPYNSNLLNESNYPLNIPTARSIASQQQNKIDMSKYTNMGYTGPEVSFTKSLQHFTKPELTHTTVSSSTSQKQQMLTTPSDSGSMSVRYGDPNSALQQMGYKNVDMSNPQQAHTNFNASARSIESITNRLSQAQEASNEYKSDVTIPRPTYNTSTIDVDQPLGLGRNMSNLSHIVDRFSNEERILAGMQTSSSYYSDKGLGTSHMFNKPISTNSSALPMFSQANIAAMQSYNQSVQGTASTMYNRQMTELQNPGLVQNESKTPIQMPVQEKKSKKRKSKSAAANVSESSQLSTTANQGFQSYAGLKGNATIEPSAISLKSSSVMPGSAFNFGPSPTGLGMGSGLYGEKDAFPNFLDEFRSAPNYYMAAAAAAHHRSTPEVNDKQSGRVAHQSSNPQAASSYPFLGTPQGRPTYPIGGPFIPNAQAQLMDTSSPLYQQYIQAGLLNQSLLGPGAYPPGYHPALSMRQQYDSMSRPTWL